MVLQSFGAVSGQHAGREVALTPAEKKALNTFFSNFSEVAVKPFRGGELSDKDYIDFGVFHNFINNNARFVRKDGEGRVKIRASYVDESVNRYFGKKIKKHQPADSIDFRDGWYSISWAAGEAVSFSQVTGWHDNGNGTFTATLDVYVAGSGWTGNPHGTMKDWEKDGDVPDRASRMKAVVKKVTENGKSRYVLIEYLKVKP